MMKRIVSVLICAAMLFCTSCAASDAKPSNKLPVGTGDNLRPYYPEAAIPVVVPMTKVLENGDVQATIHAGLLIDGYSAVLTDAQRADGFIDAVENEDKSVTYTIAADKYEAFIKKHKETYRKSLIDAAESGAYETVIGADVNEDFSFVTMYAEGEWYSGLDGSEAIFQTGIYAIFAQAFDLGEEGSVKTTVVVVDEEGTELLRGNYPENFELYPADNV